MPSTPLLEAQAVIDIQDLASAKLDAIAKKMGAITKTFAAGAKTTAFDQFDRSLAKVSAGTDKATKSLAALDKSLASVGRSSATAAGAANGLDQIARAAGSAETALDRFARAQANAGRAMSQAARSPRPTMQPTPAPATRPGRRGAPTPGSHYDRWGRLIEADVGANVAEGAATRAAKAAAELEHQRVEATAAGLSPDEAGEVEDSALALSRKYPTVPQTAIMRMMRNARAATGDLEDALAVMDPLTKLRVIAQAKNPGADVSAEFETLVKGLEIKGVAQDRAEFVKYMNGMAKALNLFGEQVPPSAYYQMFKYGRGSTRGLSEDYMLSVAPTLAAELGGSSTGVAGQAFYQAIIGGRLKTSALKELENFGLLDESKIERDKKGQPKHIGVGCVVGSDLARSDPYRWVNEVLLPAMAKKGITDPAAISDHLAAIFQNSLAQQLVSILATQQKRIEKDRNNLGNAQGLVAADEYLARDPGQALGAFTSQLENLLANAASPLMPAATATLRGLADALAKLAEQAKEHPVAAPTGLALGLGALAAGGVWFARQVLQFIGFGSSIGAGGGGALPAAAAGGGIGAALLGVLRFARGGAPPSLAASAILAAIIGGYEAADDTGRQHPYGKPGETWDRRRRATSKAADEKREKEREEADRRRQWFEEKHRRERGEATDGGSTSGAPSSASLDGLVPARPTSPGTSPLDGLAPAAGGRGAAPGVEAIASAIGAAVEAIVGKAAESFRGSAEVAIKIDASSDFVARIVRIAKRETLESLNRTGPGSNGSDGYNIDMHN